ncbi:hypothetical protein D3C76_1846820 [compost metagenome]
MLNSKWKMTALRESIAIWRVTGICSIDARDVAGGMGVHFSNGGERRYFLLFGRP